MSSWGIGSRRATEPGKSAIRLLEPRRHFYEREARAFAAELLMPFAEVRRRWFGLSCEGVSVEDMVRRLADEFAVTTSAMRVRLQQMKVVQA
jgi:Zn-dependent peptidase ImmA (M78 family)